MILNKNVQIILNPRNINYYKSLGYNIPEYYDKKHKKLSIKKGTKITVKVSDLSKGSHAKIIAVCDICKKQRNLEYKQYSPICNQCACQTNEFKSKVSLINLGRTHSEETKNKQRLNRLKKVHSSETKLKISLSNKGRPGKFGKDNPNYNPNLTDEERQNKRNNIRPWKRKVKERDEYICQCCGYIGEPNDGFMNAHHINNYANFKEQRLDINNGITLCKDCHKLLHSNYGLKTNKENLNEFLILYPHD